MTTEGIDKQRSGWEGTGPGAVMEKDWPEMYSGGRDH
jgi:hypothetical protein